ncbi:ComEC/Rec2 family competence protein [Chitinispirillales bacterium ANBcel5]|uniref:ComEC/Rec2 family competence protein n=1 Tax=Cellulosispirillum alkaliphilum TaxID=3039283 RepID=UPI002A587264|nr:ComEC/Rec2 family competence protein [Chitinispirillales bacterium ANBcel5]
MNRLKALFPSAVYWSRLPCLMAAIAFCAGIFISSLGSGSFSPLKLHPTFYITFLSMTTISALLLGVVTKAPVFRFLLFLAAGFCHYTQSTIATNLFSSQIAESQIDNAQIVLSGQVTGPVRERFGRNVFTLRVQNRAQTEAEMLLEGKLIQCTSTDTVSSGTQLTLSGQFSLPAQNPFPFGFDEAQFFSTQNISGRFEVSSIWERYSEYSFIDGAFIAARQRAHRVLEQIEKKDVSSVFKAAILGEKDEISTKVRDVFRKTGTYHLLAISGFHAGLLFLASSKFFIIVGINKKKSALLSILLLWIYLAFIGFIPSLFRATVMVSCIGVNSFFQKKSHILQALGFAALCWLIMSPGSLFSAGFQLSFCATTGILILYPVLQSIVPESNNPYISFFQKKILGSLFVSFSAFLFTAPVLLYHFGTVSIIGIVFNIIAVVLMSASMWSAFIALFSGMIVTEFSLPALFIAQTSLNTLLLISQWTAQHFPYCELSLPAPKLHVFIPLLLFCLGVCAVKHKHLLNFVKFFTPATLIILLVLHNFFVNPKQLELIHHPLPGGGVSGILWPDRTVWLMGNGDVQTIQRFIRHSIEPWLHHRNNPDVTLVIVGSKAEYAAHLARFSFSSNPSIIIMPEKDEKQFSTPVSNSYEYTTISAPLMLSPSAKCTVTISQMDSHFLFISTFENGSVEFTLNQRDTLIIREGDSEPIRVYNKSLIKCLMGLL